MKRSIWARLLALLVVFAFVAAACGNDSDDGDTGGGDDAVDTAGDDGDTDGTDGDDGGTDGDDTTGDDGDADGTTDADGGDDSAAGAPCDATVPGTSIKFAPFFSTASFDPPYSSEALVGGTELAAVYDALIRYNIDTDSYEPHVAESLEPNDDFTVWTLTLRDGIAFEDGTPLDADAVLAHQARFFEPVEGQRIITTAVAFLQIIDESTKVDDLTIEYTLSIPWAGFPYVLNRSPGFVLNVNAVPDAADWAGFSSAPPPEAGIGPYVVESNTPGESIVLKARDDYWGGPVCIETFEVVSSAAGAVVGFGTSLEAFQNGDVNMAFLREPTAIKDSREAGINEELAFNDAGAVIIFNVRESAALSDPVLREGVAKAIDVDVLNERAYNGNLPTGKAFILEGSPRLTDAVETMATDPEEAATLIADSGFTGTLQMKCPTGPEAVEVGLATEAMLEAAGVQVEVENLPTGDQIALMATGDYDLACWGYSSGPDTAAPAYFRNLKSDSAVNRQGYQSEQMDELLIAAMGATNAELPAALADINNLYLAEFLGVPYGAIEEVVITADNLMGVKQTGQTVMLLDDAYIAE